MHPAYSVIVFTTASGAGYGLMILLAVALQLGLVPSAPLFGFCGLGLALALITTGLLTSTFHLGRPERTWRAVTQWRSSWLSREGVAALVTYLPAAALGFGWVLGEAVPGQIAAGAWLAALGALGTLWCTGMIYASLPTIRAWHQPLVAPLYVLLALATGGVLLLLLLSAFGHPLRATAAATTLLLGAAWLLKRRYWAAIDAEPRSRTAEAATGLARLGTLRPLDPPHTQPNYVMREMGYRVARRHAERLRQLAAVLLFLLPLLASLLLLASLPWPAQTAIAAASAASATAGVLIERWLFFAEAEHVVMLYYRGGTA